MRVCGLTSPCSCVDTVVFAQLVSTTLAIAGTKGYPDNVRQLAVEVCLTLAQHAGPMVRKLPGQMYACFPHAVCRGAVMLVCCVLTRVCVYGGATGSLRPSSPCCSA